MDLTNYLKAGYPGLYVETHEPLQALLRLLGGKGTEKVVLRLAENLQPSWLDRREVASQSEARLLDPRVGNAQLVEAARPGYDLQLE